MPLPKIIYSIPHYGSPDSDRVYYSFIAPTLDINPDALPVIELDAAETIQKEVDYYSAHRKPIDLSHGDLLELLAELYKV